MLRLILFISSRTKVASFSSLKAPASCVPPKHSKQGFLFENPSISVVTLQGRDLLICCCNYGAFFMIPHDILLDTQAARKAQLTASWKKVDNHWPTISKGMVDETSNYKVCDI